ncbi:mevalonate kinase [Amphibacillus cookii]|uniref:mevalonate kinase n=1 Tax=Amphibacillus cookii TaxID=767787 RepID=UPI00195D06F5|nr:mevalonate kinase [Amphibacillus cookii]MBM7543089.1 mevalonate kinase [Amphibacillus cookii]
MGEHSERHAIGQAHSKLILIGEHAVVYGEPAIAIPFDAANVKAEITRSVGRVQFISTFYQGDIEHIPEKMQGLANCVKAVCHAMMQPVAHFKIELKSTIPIGRGLGSSAAIAVALVRSLYAFFNQKLSRETLMRFVDLAETYAHGTPSGIDREATSRQHPIWFKKHQQVELVSISRPLHLVVADTGRIGDTHTAVTHVKDLYKKDYLQTRTRIEKLGTLTAYARQAIQNGDLKKLGKQLDLAQVELNALGVSDPGLNYYVEVSKHAGALGAKLTGGGRGGCILALAESIETAFYIERVLKNAGAAHTWYCQISNEVIDYESNSTRTY